MNFSYITVLPVTLDQPLSVFYPGSGLGVTVNATYGDGCYTPAWSVVNQTISDPANTAILIA